MTCCLQWKGAYLFDAEAPLSLLVIVGSCSEAHAPRLGENNFGMVAIDWEARVATLTLRDEDGVAARVLAVSLGAPG